MADLDNIVGKSSTRKQFGVIKKGTKLGQTLQQDYPDIAKLWEQFGSYSEVADYLNIQLEYRVGCNVAKLAVVMAISGYEGCFRIPAYEGLITKEEKEKIATKHLQEGRRKTYEEGMGVHGRTSEQHREDGSKGGCKTYKERIGVHGRNSEQRTEDSSKGGREVYKKGLGIYRRNSEQHREDSRKGAREACILQGFTLWTSEEEEFAYQLSQQPEYRWEEGTNCQGRINNVLISNELNIKFHYGEKVRNAKTVRVKLSKYRRSLEVS